MLCSIYYHPCPERSICPPPPSVYINKKKQIPLFPTSSSSSSWVSNNESGGTASTSKNSSSSSSSRREIEVTTGSSARGRRLLKIREEKRKRQLDNLHNYPAWAKVLEDACKHDHELRAILADSIGNPDLMRKRVQTSLSLSLSPIPSCVCVCRLSNLCGVHVTGWRESSEEGSRLSQIKNGFHPCLQSQL